MNSASSPVYNDFESFDIFNGDAANLKNEFAKFGQELTSAMKWAEVGSVVSDAANPEIEFAKFGKELTSAMKWGEVGSVVSGVVMIFAIVAIVYAVIECLKQTGSALYAKMTTIDTDEKLLSKPHPSSEHVAVAIPPISRADSQVTFETVQKFISKMAREQPTRFSAEELEEFTENYSKILGSGGFGVVYKGEFPNGVQVAVKVFHNNLDKRVEELFMAEVSTIGRTYHRNLVRLYGFCFDSVKKALVYEYMENGDLGRFLFGENQELEWGKLHQIAIGTAKGIVYLHEDCEQRIIHYDIKPGNVLLDKNLNPKVADFGLAKVCNRDSSELYFSCARGTRGYVAPEMWESYSPVTHKCDVYSFGMLLFDIIGRRRNHDVLNLSESRQQLIRWAWEMFENNELAVLLSQCGIEEKDREKAEKMILVALLCVQYTADARPDMSDVVKMLDGNRAIIEPPNPFQHLESSRPNLASHNGSNEDDHISSSMAKTSEGTRATANPMHKTSEIEMAS